VTKTNRFTLLATILLGILLYMIIRFAHDLNVAWDGSELVPPPATVDARVPSLPLIETTADLRIVLNDILDDIDTSAALGNYASWSEARGFTGDNHLFAAPGIAPSDTFEARDQARLATRSEQGDADASQALATQALFVDSFTSIELFRRAAEQGSTFALLRIGSLLEALVDAGTDKQSADPVQQQRVADLAEQGIDNNLRLTALGYVVTAIRDGGAPIVDRALLAWLDRLNENTTNDEQIAVCEWSERTLLDIAGSRARWGKPAVITIPPKVFFAIPDLTDRLPCGRTVYPIDNLLDLANCTVTGVRDAGGEALDLYLCPAD